MLRTWARAACTILEVSLLARMHQRTYCIEHIEMKDETHRDDVMSVTNFDQIRASQLERDRFIDNENDCAIAFIFILIVLYIFSLFIINYVFHFINLCSVRNLWTLVVLSAINILHVQFIFYLSMF